MSDEDPRIIFGRIFRRARRDAHKTQQQAAVDNETTQKFISQVERGQADIRLTTAKKFLLSVRKRFVFHAVDEE